MNDTKTKFKGFYLLPNLFTLTGLFAGFYAVIAAMKGLFHIAPIAIFIALIFDGLDGRVARLTQTTTEFGAQLDSLCDMVCFGVAPALVLYFWSLHQLGKFGWMVAFVYTGCTALRLARFNTKIGEEDPRYGNKYSQGLTTTMAAGFIAALVWVGHSYHWPVTTHHVALIIAIVALITAVLKVSQVPYATFKELNIRGKAPFIALVIGLVVILLIASDPPDVLLVIFGGYVFSGFISWLSWRKQS